MCLCAGRFSTTLAQGTGTVRGTDTDAPMARYDMDDRWWTVRQSFWERGRLQQVRGAQF